ncbi:hypothetical protein F5Y07DRAFT_370911 [Xylaria sp. FL0933]|nr:hypothetical protein F5Y07DRAFT_370911 [Xylaria sp. FL0933]
MEALSNFPWWFYGCICADIYMIDLTIPCVGCSNRICQISATFEMYKSCVVLPVLLSRYFNTCLCLILSVTPPLYVVCNMVDSCVTGM